MARTEQVTSGLVIKQKEQSGQTILPNKSISINQLSDDVAFGLLPIGAIIPIMTHLTGAFTPGVSGQIVKGLMLCDGAAIPAGNPLTGTTPNMSNDAYLRGSTVAGNSGGANTKTLNTPQLPSHSHALTIDVDNAPHGHSASSGTANAPHGHSASPNGGVNAPATATHSHKIPRSTATPAVSVASNFKTVGTSSPTWPNTQPANAPHNQPHNTPAGNVPANNAPHSHPISVIANNAPHSHTGSIGTTGISDSINFEPNYVSCVYMIRVR